MVGGILGAGRHSAIDNCAIACTITSDFGNKIFGAIAGSLEGSNIDRVFWEKTQDAMNAYGKKDRNTALDWISKNPSKLNEESGKALSRGDAEKLGLYKVWMKAIIDDNKYTWVLLHTNGGSVDGIKRDVILTQRVFVSTPEKEGHSFKGWCENSKGGSFCNSSPLTSDSTIFYAKYSVITPPKEEC